MIRFGSGDIMHRPQSYGVLAHGCNALGVMGAGVALQIAKKWPKVAEEYRNICGRNRIMQVKLLGRAIVCDPLAPEVLGDVTEHLAMDPLIANLVTQPIPGPFARGDYISKAMQELRGFNKKAQASICMPAIGAGLGGLSWNGVKELIVQVWTGYEGTVDVFETYVPGQAFQPNEMFEVK